MARGIKNLCLSLDNLKVYKFDEFPPLQTEAIANKIFDKSVHGENYYENWDSFYSRIAKKNIKDIKTYDLRRLLLGVWDYKTLEEKAKSIIDESISRDRKPLYFALIVSYLQKFPYKHSAFKNLCAAAKIAANKYDKEWKIRETKYSLFSGLEALPIISNIVLPSDNYDNVFNNFGLIGTLREGDFFKSLLKSLCIVAGKSKKNSMANSVKLIDLTNKSQGLGSLDAHLAFALLAPFINNNTASKTYIDMVAPMLVSNIGDPRFNVTRWHTISNEINDFGVGIKGEEVSNVLKIWLVRETVNEFFEIIERTTERPDQWRQRAGFWKSYLNAGLINDACFALGARANWFAQSRDDKNILRYSTHDGRGEVSHKSSLIMKIGDVIVAEWSDNSTCKFWRETNTNVPKLHKEKYHINEIKPQEYTTSSYEALPHIGRWQPKFANRIYEWSYIKHPEEGVGYRKWN